MEVHREKLMQLRNELIPKINKQVPKFSGLASCAAKDDCTGLNPEFEFNLTELLGQLSTAVVLSTAEAQCVGAALHARTICQQGRLDSGPTAMETRPALASALRVSAGGPETLLALPKGALLPCQAQAEALVSTDKAFLRLLEADSDEVLGELEVQAPAGALDGTQTVEVVLSVSLQGALDLTVRRKGSGEVWGKFEAA